MAGFGVIVEFSRSDVSGSENLSCSGVYLGNGFVLSHGTVIVDVIKNKLGKPLLQEILRKGFTDYEKDAGLINETFQLTCSKFRVIFPNEHISSMKGKLQVPLKTTPDDHRYLCSSAASTDPQNGTHPHDSRDEATIEKPNSSSSTTKYRSMQMNPGYSSYPASVAMVFTQDGITESLSTIMPSSQGWKLTEDKDENLTTQFERILLSTFVVLRITENGTEGDVKAYMKELLSSVKKTVDLTSRSAKGTSVFVESSPFGSLSPDVFLNSLSYGIISNVCGNNNDVLLTDARCVMGSEGAPVFSDDGKSLCGLVISPFCWRQGEWLGLTLLASAYSVLTVLLHHLNSDSHDGNNSLEFIKDTESNKQTDSHLGKISNGFNSIPWSSESSVASMHKSVNEGFAKVVDSCVVGVQCGSGWGSGVIVSKTPGVIITCAHVISPATSGVVKVILADGSNLQGQVVFKTRPATLTTQNTGTSRQGKSVWDLAIIVTARSLPSSLPLASEIPPKGWPVVVAGYGVFSPRCLPTPTLSRGIVSKTINFPAQSLRLSEHQSFVMENSNSLDETGFFIVSKVRENCTDSDTREGIFSQSSQNIEPHCAREDNKVHSADSFADHWKTCLKDGKMIPLMMQTTCAVYSGTSGGAVISLHPQYGFQVVGIVVCNTQDTTNKATFPHINLAVPAPSIGRIIEEYITSGDKNVLNYLDIESTDASQLWALGVIPKSNL
ncbi:uncharacterized protein LOC122250543 isoform X2 [Penaeus japonicus]|uniref:uncharacterized protein LOC122250543 isoform X2 n=1 Tax=Penaeus japonicus TaxID=27405 RepID=UPI001C710506|nr:uncharacterized protein LOC122250543 isoform X2 [Penaeus japonicus]